MMTDKETLQLRLVNALSEISPGQWDACANPEDASHDPFVSYRFLHALEESGCVSLETGWMPRHLVLEDNRRELLGAVPMYLKHNSMGEYVFDFGWADAFERAGGKYYPKLQVSVPFTPVSGRRLLIRPSDREKQVESLLVQGFLESVQVLDVSSLHATFLTEDQWETLGNRGFLQRIDQQFQWRNNHYRDFNDFLESLSSKKRRAILRERREALTADITIEHLTGADITEAHWDAFFRFYMDTGNRKWGQPYLNRTFFSLIGQSMADRILLIMCRKRDSYIAGALNFIGGDCLFGRYWGCTEYRPYLHFELCYYQAIEFAIRSNLAVVEAGAQGEHKLARGYLPRKTYSAHWIAHPHFRAAIERFLESESSAVNEDIQTLQNHSPFRSDRN
ncbi:MAG: GNAT family N-acetyltransferase [bacterium]